MSKKLKRVVWVVVGLVVLLVAFVALAPTLVSSAAVRKELVSLAGNHLDAKLEIADMQVSWFGGLRFRGLKLGNPPGFSDGTFVACEEATGGIALWPLLRGVIDLQTIRLEKPELRLERARDGRWNYLAIVKGGAPAPGGGRTPMELPKLKAKVEARDAHVELRDDPLGTRTEASGVTVDATADLTSAEPRYEFSASVPSVAANQTMGPLLEFIVPFAAVRDAGAELSGTLKLDGHGSLQGRDVDKMLASLQAEGRFSLQNGRISGSPLCAKLLTLVREPSVFEIDSMEAPFTIRGGAVETPEIALIGKRSEIRFSGKTYLDGKLDLHAAVKAKPGAGESFLKKFASAAALKFGISGTLASPNVTPEGGSLDIDAKDVLEKGAGEALKFLEKKKKD